MVTALSGSLTPPRGGVSPLIDPQARVTLTPWSPDQVKLGGVRPVPEMTAMDLACRVAMATYP